MWAFVSQLHFVLQEELTTLISIPLTVPKHLEVLFEQSITHLEKEEQLKLLETLLRYLDVFARSDILI